MASVATKITLLGNQGDPVEMTIAAGAVIPKGSLMKISGSPQTMALATADGDFFVGIAAAESTATDTFTTLPVWTHGLFNMYSTTGMTLGTTQKIEGANAITDADDDTVAKRTEVVGIAQETVGALGTGAVLVNL